MKRRPKTYPVPEYTEATVWAMATEEADGILGDLEPRDLFLLNMGIRFGATSAMLGGNDAWTGSFRVDAE